MRITRCDNLHIIIREMTKTSLSMDDFLIENSYE